MVLSLAVGVVFVLTHGLLDNNKRERKHSSLGARTLEGRYGEKRSGGGG